MEPGPEAAAATLFLAGDVMLGRGIDQLFASSCPPGLYEEYVSSALTYVTLAERAHGPIPRPVVPEYVWGDALGELERVRPDARLVNLETSVTTSEAAAPKGINYRMHPANVAALVRLGVDVVALANNHVLDWGEAGLIETLNSLRAAGIRTVGAGRDAREASAPAALDLAGGGRLLVFAFCGPDCGVPPGRAAGPTSPGVARLADYSNAAADEVGALIAGARRPGNLVVVSLHWGSNWGYEVAPSHRRFAHRIVERAGVDLVHGHSSHHPRGLEVHRGRLILYGCGEFVNDYEGIRGREAYRGDLVLAYFAWLARNTGHLLSLEMTPLRIHRCRLEWAREADRTWLCQTLDRESGRLGCGVSHVAGGRLALGWGQGDGRRADGSPIEGA